MIRMNLAIVTFGVELLHSVMLTYAVWHSESAAVQTYALPLEPPRPPSRGPLSAGQSAALSASVPEAAPTALCLHRVAGPPSQCVLPASSGPCSTSAPSVLALNRLINIIFLDLHIMY